MAQALSRPYVVRLDRASLDADSTFWEDLVFLREHDVLPVLVAPDAPSARTMVQRINRSSNAAVCVSGADAATLPAHGADLGRVQPGLLMTLLDNGFLPVLEPTGYAPLQGEIAVDASAVAAYVAAAIAARRAFFFNDAGGVVDPATSAPIGELTPAEALLLADDERLDPQIRLAVRAAALGVRQGVEAAQILDGRIAHATIMDLLTKQHVGTEIRGALFLQGL